MLSRIVSGIGLIVALRGPSLVVVDVVVSSTKGQIYMNYQILTFFIKIQEIPYSHFQDGLFGEK